MNLDDAIRLTEIALGFAFLQQSIEHLRANTNDQKLFLPRIFLAILLIVGFHTPLICASLLLLSLLILKRFDGPYNGGSDRMGLLILCGLCGSHFLPIQRVQETVLGYIALQLVLSYFIAGWVKLKNPDWRTGRALWDVFQFSAYPVSEHTRRWAEKPHTLRLMSWAVILFELLFPLSLATQPTLILGLLIAACFHLANACLFGLNRFFWVWLAAYPSLLWLQQRLFQ